jgi:hypothetical protein
MALGIFPHSSESTLHFLFSLPLDVFLPLKSCFLLQIVKFVLGNALIQVEDHLPEMLGTRSTLILIFGIFPYK